MEGFAATAARAIQAHATAHGVPTHTCVVVLPSQRAGLAVRRALVHSGVRLLPRLLTLDDVQNLATALHLQLPAVPAIADEATALWRLQNAFPHLPAATRLAQAVSVWNLAKRLGHYGHTLADAAGFNPALAAAAQILDEMDLPASLVHNRQLMLLADALPQARMPVVTAGFRDDAHGVPPGVRAVLQAAATCPLGVVVPAPAGHMDAHALHHTLLAADQPMHEARLVALAVRQALADGHTPTVVCASAPLTSAIADALTLAGVACDASAGQPLAHTAAGGWLTLLLNVLAEPTAQALAALCAHPLTQPTDGWPAFAHALDAHIWRGVRVSAAPQTRWADWQEALDARLDNAGAALSLAQHGFKLLNDVLAAFDVRTLAITEWVDAVRVALNTLAPTWRDGPYAADLITLLEQMAHLEVPASTPTLFTAWLGHHLGTTVVRPPRNTQAVPLLGPQEARLGDANSLIFAGMNAGIWPSTPREEWLDAAARQALGFPPDGTPVLHATTDFLALWASCDHATATYSITDMTGQDLAPSPALLALLREIPAEYSQAWAANGTMLRNWLDAAHRPAPADETQADTDAVFSHVPLRTRWSASYMGTLMQCPYRAALGRTLHLDDPEGYAALPSAAEHGTLMHRWLEAFTAGVPGLPGPWAGVLNADSAPHAIALLNSLTDALLRDTPTYTRWVLEPRLRALAPALVDELIRDGHGLGTAEKRMTAQVGPITFTAIADRLADTPQGLLVVDYKTGAAPNRTNVLTGRKPQLAIEAFIGSQKGPLADVQVWHLKGYGQDPLKVTGFRSKASGLDDIAAAAADGMARYATAFGHGQAHPAVAGPWCSTCALASVCRTAAMAGDDAEEAA